jgi:hypothetical protein
MMPYSLSERVCHWVRIILGLGWLLIIVSLILNLSTPLLTESNFLLTWPIKLINVIIALVTCAWLAAFGPNRRGCSISEGGAGESLSQLKRMGFGEKMLEDLAADEVDVLARRLPHYLAAHNWTLFCGVLTALANNDGLVTPGFGIFLNVLRTQLFLGQEVVPHILTSKTSAGFPSQKDRLPGDGRRNEATSRSSHSNLG